MLDSIGFIIASIFVASTPLILAALGELVVEKVGVLNLGIEGMMLIGAVASFAGAYVSQSITVGIIVGIVATMLVTLIFAVLTQNFMVNQTVCGLSLTILGVGISSLVGQNYIGVTVKDVPKIHLGFLSDIPLIGKAFLQHDLFVYFAMLMVLLAHYFFKYNKFGLILRALGDNHYAAYTLGYKVRTIRYGAILFGAAMASLGGAYLSLVYTPHWVNQITAGRGWIALSLVVFASWMPQRILWGALLFGSFSIAQLYLQGIGITFPSQFLSMLPYVVTIITLAFISKSRNMKTLLVPRCLGQTFEIQKKF